MVKGNLRSEENTYLSFPPSIAKDYPDEVLEAYGYLAPSSGLGVSQSNELSKLELISGSGLDTSSL